MILRQPGNTLHSVEITIAEVPNLSTCSQLCLDESMRGDVRACHSFSYDEETDLCLLSPYLSTAGNHSEENSVRVFDVAGKFET